MSSDVQIDGIKYVPVTEVKSLQIKKIRQVLESQKYLSKSAIEEIIKALDESPKKESPKVKSKPKKASSQYNYDKLAKTHFNISGVLSNGSVLYKTRKSPADWKIQQAIIVRSNMNNDTCKGVTHQDIRKLAKKVNLSEAMVRKIMFNIEHGDMVNWINYWNTKFNQKPLKATKPVENNPQKRRESVLYG